MSKKAKERKKARMKTNGAARSRKPAKRSERSSARSQTLPGFEQVRDQVLDNLCEALYDERKTQNASIQEQRSLVQSGLDRMHLKSISVYKHAGIELALVPGSDRLRVRLLKDQSDAAIDTGMSTETTGEADGEEDVDNAADAE